MRGLLTIILLLAVLATGAAQPTDPAPGWDPNVRLFYESDTRAYYRPCG